VPASTTVDTPNGRRYEITFIDSSGKQRWQTVQGGLKEAHAARGDILSKLGRGERVAPTRKTMAVEARFSLTESCGPGVQGSGTAV
jgi:hypothetical protein